MKRAFLTVSVWLTSDPRRLTVVTLVALTVLAVTLAVVPGSVAQAVEITSGSGGTP
jgi:hypothetical protein